MKLNKSITLNLAASILLLVTTAVAQPDKQTPTCKTSWPVQVCYTISSSPTASHLTVGITALETQSENLPITGYVVNGRAQLEDGSFAPFQLVISRDNWTGENSAVISIPTSNGSTIIGVAKLTVIVRRNSENVIIK